LDNDGTTQPAAPSYWDTLLSTIQLVTWDNDGTTQPSAAPEKNKLLGYFYFQQLYLYLDNDEPAQPAAPRKKKLLGYTFNNSTCTWDNDGTAKPAAPEKQTVGTLHSTPLVLGIMMEPPTSTEKNKLLGYFYFQQFYLYVG
jgi:hypothetical protein